MKALRRHKIKLFNVKLTTNLTVGTVYLTFFFNKIWGLKLRLKYNKYKNIETIIMFSS